MRALFAAVIAALTCCGQSLAATVLYYTSTPGSYIGGGQTITVTPTTNYGFNFDAVPNFDNGWNFFINDSAQNPDPQSQQWWYVWLAAPQSAALVPGLYLDATRWPFQADNEPGLWFAGNGRGNNMITGYFRIFEIQLDLTGTLIAFAADFLQYDETQTVDYSWGSIRYNSSVPVTLNPVLNPVTEIPVPPALLLFGVGVVALSAAKRRMKAGHDSRMASST